MIKYIANIITSLRILCSILLLFFIPFTVGFYIVYLLCGFSDMIDGTVARKTNAVSVFGAKLDFVADLVFMSVSLLKLLPRLQLPIWLWIWIIAIAVIKLGNLICGYIRDKRLIVLHTIMNKITGIMLFALPFTLSLVEFKYSCFAVCIIATITAFQEVYYIATKQEIV